MPMIYPAYGVLKTGLALDGGPIPNANMTPRHATIADTGSLAQMHVLAWEETYRGLLPDAAIAARDLAYRLDIYQRIISAGTQVSVIPGVGFAQMGQQRGIARAARYPQELISFYVLQAHHGTGAAQSLLHHALGDDPQPFTAAVLYGNARAIRFYEKTGGQHIGDDGYTIAGDRHADMIFGFDPETVLSKLQPAD